MKGVSGTLLAGGLALAMTARAATTTARAASPPRLWYPRPAQKWVEALPIGNGRLGAMLFGGVEAEALALNEQTLWSGGPYDPANPEARAALPRVRALLFAGKYAEAQALVEQKMRARPPAHAEYQPVGTLSLKVGGGAKCASGAK